MPVSPTELNRNKISLSALLILIDKRLKVADKLTLASATYLVVDAPFGYYDYKESIIETYLAVGWAKVEIVSGKSILQDKILFYPNVEENYIPLPPASVGTPPIASVI